MKGRLKPKSDNLEKLTRYLLDELPADERERIEHEYLCDETLHEELLAVESELFDAYHSGELSDEEGRRLTKNLDPDELRQRAVMWKTLNRWIEDQEAPVLPIAAEVARPFGFWPRLRMPILILATAVIALVAVRFSRQRGDGPDITGQPQETARLEPAAPMRPADLTLIPANRSLGALSVLPLPRQERILNLGFVIDSAVLFAGYSAVFTALDDSSSQTIKDLRASATATGQRQVLAAISSSKLRSGDYRVTVSGTRDDVATTIAGYMFRVERE